ncbi:MAG: Ig-like domain-containing protein, partial [Peptococcaceae bacterium]|nr:Ig-like domain-containing protein [Peptococcaceae bacterium]
MYNGTQWSNVGANIGGSYPVYVTTVNGAVYAGTSAGGVFAWNGSTWLPVEGPSGIDILVANNGILYAATQDSEVWSWNGSAWSQVGIALADSIHALFPTHDGMIYAGTAGGVFAWNGSAWSQVGDNLDSGISTLATVDGTVYAGTNNGVWSWNGSAWSPVGGNLESGISTSLAIVDGAVYTGTNGAGVWSWNGSAWSPVGSLPGGNGSSANIVGTLATVDGTVYAGDYGGNVWSWNGTQWSNVGDLSSNDNAEGVYALATLNGTLYAQAGAGVWSWNGSAWSSMGRPTSGYINSLATYGTLYAGATIGSPESGSDVVLAWNGSAWSQVGSLDTAATVASILPIGGFLYVGTSGQGVWTLTPPTTVMGVKVQVNAAPVIIPSDGTSTSAVTATVTLNGSPAAGVTVDFSTTAGTLSATSATTDAQGVAAVTLTSATTPGTGTVTATADGVSGTATVTFGTLHLLFTSDQSLVAGSVWGKALPAAGSGSTTGQSLPWTFAQATFLVSQTSGTGDVIITGSAEANYDIRVSYTNPQYGPTDSTGTFSPTGNTTIDLDQLPIPFNEGGDQGRTVTI